MFQRFLSAADAERATQAFAKLARHDIGQWALTGGVAIEIHLLRLGRPPSVRPLNDLDFVTESFDCIPRTLGAEFLFRHVHPLDPPGKTILQAVDPDRALRIDVFRAYGATMRRTSPLDLPSGTVRLVSLEDLAARAARLAMNLAEGVPVPSKHARDFLRLAELVDFDQMEAAWQDHRRETDPVTFAEAKVLLQELIPAHPELLVTPDYSHDADHVCQRCAPTAAFHLADPSVVLALLGYC